tara:strand:+ start:560 stop:2122 length:1563 start_codon:yes stop_codon:yes gene_type:complete
MTIATVCILTSGTGSRLQNYTKNKNKSLLSLKKESILSKIFKNFPTKTKFIISTGYKSQQVKDFVKIHHPELDVNFVEIKNFNGKKSGPAFSLYKCKKYLQKPFFFVSCDTIWKKKIDNFQFFNWMGVYSSKQLKSEDYCSLVSKNNNIVRILDKKKISNKKNTNIFVGLAFIKDYRLFWEGFDFSSIREPQVSMGFQNLLNGKKKIKTVNIDWEDSGTKEKYENLIVKHEKYNFNKENQQIYISNSKVTKYFDNKKIVKNLFKKALIKKKVFPKNMKMKNNFISYNFIEGKTMYNFYDIQNFELLLKFLEKNLWNENFKKTKKFTKDCQNFYYHKTHERIKKFLKNNRALENPNIFYRRLKIKGLKEILNKIDWKYLCNGLPQFIHGDLQFDNILMNRKKEFKLIDWRQSFGKSVRVGDQYYDFAKLLGGLEINYDLIKKNRFDYELNKENVKLKIPKRKNTQNLIICLEKFLNKRKFDLKKVRILTGLIFLNMSPLHHKPFDKLLFIYGKYYLQKNLF